ncbi:MAG: VWA domain-containing protein [Proteobacteria bacterium]|nr:VWA domain-containing protein [Pseudomonadota bacterium]
MMALHFLRPYWLLAFFPLALIVWRLFKLRYVNHAWSKVCDSHLLPHLLVQPTAAKNYWPLILLATAWLITIIALAGPTWTKKAVPIFKNLEAEMIVLDLSPAMSAQDLTPNRLTRAKYKLQDILNRMTDGQVGLVVFSGEAYTVSPFTQDAATISAMIPDLDPSIMPVQGSNIGAGLQKAKQLFEQAKITHGNILLITASDVSSSDYAIAKSLNQQGYTVSVLGMGTTKGAPISTENGFLRNSKDELVLAKLPEASLQRLAEAGGGRYMTFTENNRDIDYLLPNPDSLPEEFTKGSETAETWQDSGRWLLLLIIPIALLAFRRGWFERI